MELITKVTLVPLAKFPIVQIPVVELYSVPAGASKSIIVKWSDGNKSFKVTLVALVPLPAFETTIVQTATSSTKYSSLSLVILTEISTIGTG